MSKKHLICTIIAPNYLSQALTLGQSVARNMPNVSYRILILQDSPDKDQLNTYLRLSSYEKIQNGTHEFNTFNDVDWEDFDLIGSVNRYELLEFATAVKPALIRHYLKDGWERVTYVDPDIFIFQDFSNLLSENLPISLTPHTLEQMPSDGLLPNNQSILYAGIYNLGFISCTSKAKPFLNWWSDVLEDYCTMDIGQGYHVDQRWVDWAPIFCKVEIVKNPGFNVAYWNLHERRVQFRGNHPIVLSEKDKSPLYFFHFSGFDDFKNYRLSKHATRVFDEKSLDQRIIKDYARIRTLWFDLTNTTQWDLGGRVKGLSLPEKVRLKLILQSRNQKILDEISKKEISRENNAELTRHEFGSLAAAWLLGNLLTKREIRIFSIKIQNSIRKMGISISEIQSGIKILSQRNKTPTIKIVGYFAAPTGLGAIARNTADFLKENNIEFTTQCIRTSFDSSLLYEEYKEKFKTAKGNENICLAFINADMWMIDSIASGAIDRNKQFVAGVWAWEIEEIPNYFKQIAKHVDQIYAISNFSSKALEKKLDKNVKMLPTFSTKLSNQELKRSELDNLNLPQKYILVRFDSKSVIKRKNPQSAIKVWESIQNEYKDYHLVVKTLDFEKMCSMEELECLKKSPRTILIDKELTPEQNRKLLTDSKCYLSLHRAEGLGLNILESIFADVPVVFTDYSGLAEELLGIGFHVGYKKVKIGNGAFPYSADAYWAEPDINDAIIQLKTALELVENGNWEKSASERQSWIENFSKKNQTVLNDEVKSLFASVSLVEHRFDRYEKFFPKINYKILSESNTTKILKVWKIFPSALRKFLKPKITSLYFSLLKEPTHPNFKEKI